MDPQSVGDLELRSDLSATLLLPQKAQTGAAPGADVGCVEFVGSVSKKAEQESAPTCLLVFDAATNSFTLERVETAAILKQVVRDDAPTTRKRKMVTPATMQRRAEVAAKRAMPVAHAPAAPAPASVTAATCVSSSAAAVAAAAPASAKPHRAAPSAPLQRPLAHITSGKVLTPEESMAQEFAEDDGMDVVVHALDTTPISLNTLLDPASVAGPSAADETAAAAPARPAPAASVSMDFSFMNLGADALKAAAAAAAQPAPAPAAPMDLTAAGASFPSSSHDSVCSFCCALVAIDPADAHCDTDSAQTDAEKEQRRDYLHCDSCFEFSHKKCVAETTKSAEGACRRPDRSFTCPNCE